MLEWKNIRKHINNSLESLEGEQSPISYHLSWEVYKISMVRNQRATDKAKKESDKGKETLK